MSGMHNTPRSFLPGDCEGSGQPAALESATFTGEAWTAYCPACGGQVSLGYAGIVLRHDRRDGNEEPMPLRRGSPLLPRARQGRA
jgi:hypothetical protein